LEDGLYHLNHAGVSETLAKMMERTYPTDDATEKEMPEEQLRHIGYFIKRTFRRKDGKPTRIWDPFVGSGRSAKLWKSMGFEVFKHNSLDDFFDPNGPVSGIDYDFPMIWG
jgi:hypothetical protein